MTKNTTAAAATGLPSKDDQPESTMQTQPKASDQWDSLDTACADARALVHQLRFLMIDLEEGFRVSRGRPRGAAGLDFTFQEYGIDATLWLASEAYIRAANLSDCLRNLQAAFDAAEGGAS